MDVKKKKLLFILPTLNTGGAEKVTVNIINKLDKNIFDITLIVIDSRYKNLEAYINKDIPLKYLHISKTRNAFFEVFKQIKKIKPDVVYSSLNRTNILILIIKLIYPFFNVIIREPNMPSAQMKSNDISTFMMFFIKLLYPRATKIIAQSRYMKEEIETIFYIDSSEVVAMKNPLDVKSIIECLDGKVSPFIEYENSHNFVYIGRLSEQKNPLFLVEVFKRVVSKNNKFHLFIVGDGYLKEEINKKVIDYALEDNIHLLGFQSNPYPYIKYADGLLLCSKWEGMPNVVMEALHLHTIVVTTDSTPVLKDLIIDGENGYIVDDFDVDRFSQYVLEYKSISNKFQDIESSDFDKLFLENS